MCNSLTFRPTFGNRLVSDQCHCPFSACCQKKRGRFQITYRPLDGSIDVARPDAFVNDDHDR